MAKSEKIYLEVEGPSVEPGSVDSLAFLELASSFYDALSKAAAVSKLELGLHGIEVRDKCVQIEVGTRNAREAQLCANLLAQLVDGSIPPRHGMAAAIDRLRDARRRFPESFEVKTRVGRWSGLLRVPEAAAGYEQATVESLRAKVIDVGGKEPRVRLESPSIEKPFSLSITESLARELGGTSLYLFIDLVAEAIRDQDGNIVSGKLVRFTPVTNGDAASAWRDWYRSNGSEWDDVEDIESDLGRGDRE